MKEQIVDFLHQFIEERGAILDKENLLSLSFKNEIALDSFEILTLVMEIELTFDIKIQTQELIDTRTDNVGIFVDMIMSKLPAANP